LAKLAEAVGFDSFWVSEHHGSADAYLPSLTIMLAAVAAVTSRIQLATAVVLAPFQHPLRFAEDCVVLDQLSRGRLLVGIGAGWRKEEFRAFGIPTTERVGRTAELAQVCRLAWTHERFSFDGRYFHFTNAAVTPRPVGTLRLLMGGSADSAIARAAQLGDGFIGTPQNRLSEFERQVSVFDAAAREAGRDPAQLAIGFHVNAWISPDGHIPPPVEQAMWHQLGTYAAWHAEDAGLADPPAPLPSLDRELIHQRAMFGTAEDVVSQARPWVDTFGDRELHTVFRLHYPGMRRESAEMAIRQFAERVMPALKGGG
jgi:probable F420-dependent oxidoreductase